MRILRNSALLMATAGMLAACGGAGSQGGQGGDIVLAEVQGPDRGWAIDTDDAFVLTRFGVTEPLTRINFDGELEPALAASWQRIDPESWSFTLRDGVEFQDGEPLTADAVVTALTYVLNSSTPPRSLPPDLVAAVEAEGDEVVIRTIRPDPLMPLRLASPSTAVLAPAAYEAEPNPDPFGHGTGPFVLSGYNAGQDFDLEANPSYWGGEVGIDSAKVRIVPDEGVRSGMAQTGEADIVMHLPIPMLQVLGDVEGIDVLEEPEPRTETLYLNQTNPVLSDVRVRRAISHAIDNDTIAATVFEGAAVSARGPFLEWEPWANPEDLTLYDYDPEESKRLLRQAGYDKDDLSFEMVISSRLSYFTDMAVAIQAMLEEIGITVNIRTQEYAALEPDLLKGNYEIYLGSRGHLLDVNDPIGWFVADYTCDGTYNLSQYCDPEFDKMVAQRASIDDTETRWDEYQKLTEWLQVNAISHFVVHPKLHYAVDTGLAGVDIHPLNQYLLTADIRRTK